MLGRFGSVLFWSVIAAAFIGPGTVTTAASAGAGHGYALLWTLLFSTLACLLLQEAAARLTVVSGLDLGQALSKQYAAGPGRVVVLTLVLSFLVGGCAWLLAGSRLPLNEDKDVNEVLNLLAYVAAALLPAFVLVFFLLDRN